MTSIGETFPFLNEAKAMAARMDVTVLASPEVRQRAARMIEQAYIPSARSLEAFEPGPGLVTAHLLMRLVLAMLDMPIAIHRVATQLAKFYELKLHAVDLATLRHVAIDQGLAVEAGSFHDDYQYKVPFTDYLHVSVSIQDPHWKLVNRPVQGGHVFLTTHELARLLAETVSKHVGASIGLAKQEGIEELFGMLRATPGFTAFLDSIKAFINECTPKATAANVALSLDNECFPPCVLALLEKLRSGQNLSHHQRLFLVSFLSWAKMPAASIVGLFASQPDFKPETTAYQVASIEKGGYAPSSCGRLRSLSSCPDPRCGAGSKVPLKNPMVFYRRALRRKADPSKKP